MRGAAGPRGLRKNHSVRGHAAPVRRTAQPGAGGPREHLFGHRPAGEGAGDYHLFQAGAAELEGVGAYPFGHTGPRGFFRRDGTGGAGDGLCGAAHQRLGRSAGAHRDVMAAAGPPPCAHLFIYQQNGPAGYGPGQAHGPGAETPGRWLRRFFGGEGGAAGAGRPVRRGADGAVLGDGGAGRR